ncbi:MAG TPA: hypothetical protein DCZ11_09915 [Gammaproteobacteria bacterium]|jgi:hypothetical protein|nr:hypothetical protein [Gammaproteobacteria bacterium]MCH78747.1 hypothetical protein [Gammaproteobacteria bacterium]
MLWRAVPTPYRVLIVAAVVTAALCAGFAVGHRHARNTWALRYVERENELLRTVETQTSWARALEQSLFRRSIDLEAAYLQGVFDVQARTDRTISDLRAGNLRLRHELTSAACDLSGSGAASGSDHAGTLPDVWRTAAEDLVQLADECDAVVHQLSACQGLLRIHQEMK